MAATARQERALSNAAKVAVLAQEQARDLRETRQRLNQAIRNAHRTGVSYDVIAHRVGVTKARIAQIVKGR